MPDISADLQALLDRVVESAAHLCGADDSVIQMVDSDRLVRVAHAGPLTLVPIEPLQLDRETSFGGRALLDKTVVQVDDVQAIKSGTAGQRSRASGARTVLWAPLILAADAIG